MIGNTTDETNFPHKLLLNDIKASSYKLCKALAYNSFANINSSNTQISIIKRLSEFLGTRLEFTNNLTVFPKSFQKLPKKCCG